MKRQDRLPRNGRLLQLVGLGHLLVGLAIYRDELRAISRDGVVGGIPYRGPKATAFWFLLPSALIWIVGQLLNVAEETGDPKAVRTASRLGAASAIVCIVCIPVSGFWAWLLISLRGLRDARRMES